MPTTQMNLAGLARQRGDLVAEEAGYRRALAMDSYFTPAYTALASALSNQRRNADAEAVLREGIKRVPREGSLHYSLGLLLAEEKHDTEAIVELQKAAELTPGQPRIHYNLGLLQQQRGQLAGPRTPWRRRVRSATPTRRKHSRRSISSKANSHSHRRWWKNSLPRTRATPSSRKCAISRAATAAK
jgi:Flp pilus assembly protein TadD